MEQVNEVILAGSKTVQEWADGISTEWRKSVDGIINTGRLIAEALEDIKHGEKAALYESLPFSKRTALRLMDVSNDKRLSNVTHVSHLPASWGTLYELSKLDDDKFKQLEEAGKITPELERNEVVDFAKKEKRKEEIARQTKDIEASTPEAPDGLFNVISIDPPWPYDEGNNAKSYDPSGRRAANPYPEMSLDEIAGLYIPASDDCVLWFWTTHKFMRDAFSILDLWGFKDKAILTWVKDRMGLGLWLRSQSEFCIMAVKGKPVVNLTNQTTVINGPLREHSRKPDEFFAMVDELCIGRKLEYFSREPRQGWEQFGNEKNKFD